MTDDQGKPNSTDQESSSPQVSDLPDENDLAALDLAISEHDPEFSSEMSSIGPDLQPENLDLFDLNTEAEQLEEKKIPKFFDRIRRSIKRQFQIFLTRLILVFKQTIPDLAKSAFELLKAGINLLKAGLKSFAKLSGLQKLAFTFCLLVIAVTASLVYKFSTGGILNDRVQLFTTDLEQLSEKAVFIAEDENYESFYDSSRVSQNVMNLRKMTVNLRASRNSGSQPMAAIEFFVEGYAPEVVIEVKDREAEIQDLFQRLIEEMTYDEIDQTSGKINLQERLRDRVNQILTQGNVKRVFFKNIILKP